MDINDKPLYYSCHIAKTNKLPSNDEPNIIINLNEILIQHLTEHGVPNEKNELLINTDTVMSDIYQYLQLYFLLFTPADEFYSNKTLGIELTEEDIQDFTSEQPQHNITHICANLLKRTQQWINISKTDPNPKYQPELIAISFICDAFETPKSKEEQTYMQNKRQSTIDQHTINTQIFKKNKTTDILKNSIINPNDYPQLSEDELFAFLDAVGSIVQNCLNGEYFIDFVLVPTPYQTTTPLYIQNALYNIQQDIIDLLHVGITCQLVYTNNLIKKSYQQLINNSQIIRE